MKRYDDYLRWLYRGGHPNRFARLQNRASAIAFAAGIAPRRAAALEITGRRSGRVISFPVVITDAGGERYLVSMLGANANWVRNLTAAGGRAVLRHGRRESVYLEEVQPAARAPILRRYLRVAPGARPHIPVDRRAPLAEFARIAADYPVFRVRARPGLTPGRTSPPLRAGMTIGEDIRLSDPAQGQCPAGHEPLRPAVRRRCSAITACQLGCPDWAI